MTSSIDVEKLYNDTKVRATEVKNNDTDRFKLYNTFETKADTLGKLYYLQAGNLTDYYVTYKMNPEDNDVIKKYQGLGGKVNSTLSQVGALGDSISTSIESTSKSLQGDSEEIGSFQRMFDRVATLQGRLGGVDATSQQMVYDFGTKYSMQNIFFGVQVVLVIGFAIYFFGVNSDRGKNLAIFLASIGLFFVLFIIVMVLRQEFRDNPEGPSKVTTTDGTFQNIENTVSDTCFEESCCTASTEWVSGQGCVAIDAVDDASESFRTYKSMSN